MGNGVWGIGNGGNAEMRRRGERGIGNDYRSALKTVRIVRVEDF